MSEARSFDLGVLASALAPDLRDAAAQARMIGFDGMLIDAQGIGVDLTNLSISGRREFLRALTSQQQKLIGLRVEIGHKGFAPGADVDRALKRLDDAMRTAADLRCGLVCADVGLLPAPPRQQTPPRAPATPEQAGRIIIPSLAAPAPQAEEPATDPVDPAFAGQVQAALGEAGRLADRYSVAVAFGNALSSFTALDAALRGAACPWFGVDLDPVALLRDSWDADAVFSALGSRIRHVRARDALRGSDRRARPVPIGQGDADWPSLLTRLQQSDYRGALTVDPTDLADPSAAVRAGLNFLRGHVA